RRHTRFSRDWSSDVCSSDLEDVVDRIASGELPKGEALATARLAGIMGAKRTSDLIPLCHPLPLTGIEVDLAPRGDHVEITATVPIGRASCRERAWSSGGRVA